MIGESSIQSRGLLRYNNFPVKAYPFTKDFDKLYGTTEEALREIANSITSLPGIMGNPITSRPYLYALSFPWGYIERGGPVRCVDWYGFEFDREFDKCNPEWNPTIFRDSRYDPDSTKGCGTGLILLGKEEALRRVVVANGGTLETYLKQWANLGYLGPVDKRIASLEVKK